MKIVRKIPGLGEETPRAEVLPRDPDELANVCKAWGFETAIHTLLGRKLVFINDKHNKEHTIPYHPIVRNSFDVEALHASGISLMGAVVVCRELAVKDEDHFGRLTNAYLGIIEDHAEDMRNNAYIVEVRRLINIPVVPAIRFVPSDILYYASKASLFVVQQMDERGRVLKRLPLLSGDALRNDKTIHVPVGLTSGRMSPIDLVVRVSINDYERLHPEVVPQVKL